MKRALLTSVVAATLAIGLTPSRATDFTLDLRAAPLYMLVDPLFGLSARATLGLGAGPGGFALRGEFGGIFLGLDALYRMPLGDGQFRLLLGPGIAIQNIVLHPVESGQPLPIYARATLGFEYPVTPNVVVGLDAVPTFRLNPQPCSGGYCFNGLEQSLALLNFGVYVGYRF